MEASVAEVLARPAGISIIDLVAALIEQAHALRASDIHIDPSAGALRVRLRIDGVLQKSHSLPRHIHNEVVARIKVLAGMRTDEHQQAQDGRFRHALRAGGMLDVRVSIAPTYHGENAVLRLLSDRAAAHTLSDLGFSESDKDTIMQALRKPHGMILATGPTGSGKTTTLYTLVGLLNAAGVSIVTIEDPIEYAMEGVEQIQVNPRSGLTFANGLRSILRQDPDIIMVGEIRDQETAAIAVNTALTGHLLLSTLHTNDAATTLPRLLDMGVDAYLVASTVNIAIGQRLVRRICELCREAVVATPSVVKTLSVLDLPQPVVEGEQFSRGQGCPACNNSGYAGRVAISEVLVATPALRDAIRSRAPSTALVALAQGAGMTTLLADGFAKARAGLTTVEEILRVVHE
jgi:general secretion pathway protein E